MGLGVLFRSQLAGISAVIGILVIEVTLEAFVPSIARWLPFSADAALVGTSDPLGGLLPVWGGGLLLAGYGLAFAAGGTGLLWTWFAVAWTYAVLTVPILLLPAALDRRGDPVLRVAT